MQISRWLQRIARFSPVAGVVLNKIRFPKLRCSIFVDLPYEENFQFDNDVQIGAFSRIYITGSGKVILKSEANLCRNVHLQTDNGQIVVGQGSSIQDGCRLYGDVSVGRGCLFAPNVYVSSGTHVFGEVPYLPIQIQEVLYPVNALSVIIGDDCWLGVNAVVMPGISIGKGCIVGAGSVVTESIPPYTVVAGVPAKTLRRRYQFKPPESINSHEKKDWPYFYSGFEYQSEEDNKKSGFHSNGRFCVALNKKFFETISINVKSCSDKASVRYGDRSYVIGEKVQSLIFPVPMENRSVELFEFEVSGCCQLISAELT